jgi:ribosomal protein S18 acetylase RimI-like enzyme
MARSLEDLPPVPDLPPEVTIREVVTPEDLRIYVEMQARRWQAEHEQSLLLEFNHWAGMGANSRRHRWLVFLDGRPVGKAFTSVVDDVVGLYGVSTEPEARGRGLATAVTITGLRAARGQGCRAAVLHSTEMAVGLYRGLGFEELCQIPIYARP